MQAFNYVKNITFGMFLGCLTGIISSIFNFLLGQFISVLVVCLVRILFDYYIREKRIVLKYKRDYRARIMLVLMFFLLIVVICNLFIYKPQSIFDGIFYLPMLGAFWAAYMDEFFSYMNFVRTQRSV